jgi:hypothetical protein
MNSIIPRSALVGASPTGSPTPEGTSITVVATFSFNGQSIVINTGDIASGNFIFTLNQPVVLGTFLDFVNWLNDEFNVPISEQQIIGAIDSIPTSPEILNQIRNALIALVNGSVTITVLNVNTQAGTFQFGITYTVPDSPAITFLGITFNQLGVMVQKVGVVSSPSSP